MRNKSATDWPSGNRSLGSKNAASAQTAVIKVNAVSGHVSKRPVPFAWLSGAENLVVK